MTQGTKYKLEPRLLKGFRDIFPEDYLARQWMIEQVRRVYERYGFVPLETPALEYAETLGKYIQENDSAAEGVFAFRDDDKELISMRYDLTAPLSRVVAQYNELPSPFRRYQLGVVWRDEKPGPGRFREFYQFDIDIVGSAEMSADAEVCCVICQAMEQLNLKRGEYQVRVNNRKVLNGILEMSGIPPANEKGEPTEKAMAALRAVDKLDRLGLPGVIELLGKGRKDESGDFMKGANLEPRQIEQIEKYLQVKAENRAAVCNALAPLVGTSAVGQEGINELREIDQILTQLGIGENQVIFDPTIVRGLSYYTGPVFETVLTITHDAQGNPCSFGSVFSGGRYDGLVERFLGTKVPATGASIGLDRLLESLKRLGRIKTRKATAQVFIVTMDKSITKEYHTMAATLRDAGINTEIFLGKGGIKKQLKYADYWDIPLAIIVGGDEVAKNEVTIKNLRKGRVMAQEVANRQAWLEGQPAQVSVAREKMLETIQNMLKEV